MELKNAEIIIRDRFTVAKHVICADENRNKTFADGYFKGWMDATLIILNAIDRTDLLSVPTSETEEVNESDPIEKLKSLFRLF